MAGPRPVIERCPQSAARNNQSGPLHPIIGRDCVLRKKIVRAEQISSAQVFVSVSESSDVIESLLNNYSSLTRIERILASLDSIRVQY